MDHPDGGRGGDNTLIGCPVAGGTYYPVVLDRTARPERDRQLDRSKTVGPARAIPLFNDKADAYAVYTGELTFCRIDE